MFKPVVKSKVGEDICILIQLDNHPWNYICDCGDASELSVKEVQNTNAVFISHTHIDHFVNFDAIIRHQIGIERKVIIVGPKGIAAQVQAKLKSYTWNLIKEGAILYEVREIEANGIITIYELEPPTWELKRVGNSNGNIVFEEKAFHVSYTILNHKTPSIAYKFKELDTLKINLKDSNFKSGKWAQELKLAYLNKTPEATIKIEEQTFQAKALFHLLHTQIGDSVGVIMDHAATPENHAKIKAVFYKARNVFIECFYKDEDKENAEKNFHSYASMSGKIMKELEIEKPIPVHFSRKYNTEDIATLKQQFNAAILAK